jgi:hypothetical protein
MRVVTFKNGIPETYARFERARHMDGLVYCLTTHSVKTGEILTLDWVTDKSRISQLLRVFGGKTL